MESKRAIEARRNEIGYCGQYCRTCHWYTDALRKPAAELLNLLKSHFEVKGWIEFKGRSSEETLKGLEILSKSACTFNCKGGGGWRACPVRRCCTAKGVDFCFKCTEFPCERNWGETSEHANVFTPAKIERLHEMKQIGVEESIRKQWK